MDSLQTWLIVGAIAAVGLWLLHTVFHSIGTLVKWGITIAILVALFGWGAVAEVPGKIWNWVQSVASTNIEVKINGQPIKCSVTPTVSEAENLVSKSRPAIDGLLGNLTKDVEIKVVESKDCAGKASLQLKSASVEAVNKIKDGIQNLLPNLPVTVTPK